MALNPAGSFSLLLLLCLLTLATSQLQLRWFVIDGGQEDAPGVREEAALGYDKGRNRLIMFGGRGKQLKKQMVLGDTWIYNIGAGTWVELSPVNSPPHRFHTVYGVSGKYFYVATGEGINGVFLDDIWRFDLETENWEELPVEQRPDYYTGQQWTFKTRDQVKPDYRYGAAGGIFPNSSHFYLSHGFDADEQRYSDTFTYNVVDKGWAREYPDRSPYSPRYPHARCLAAGTMISTHELIIFGGCLSGGKTAGPCPSGDSWIFNGKTKKWKQLDGCASPRTQASLAMLPIKNGERRAVLYGGKDTGSQVISNVKYPADQVAVFNPDTEDWTLRQSTGEIPSKRRSVATATGPDGIFYFGGLDLEEDDLLNDIYLLAGDGSTADHAPKDADCNPTFINYILIHGILMALGWGLFLFWGAFVARYLQHRAPLWFNLHRLFQVFGLMLALGGLACGVLSVKFDHFKFAHGIIGLVAVIAAVLQPLIAVIRPRTPLDGMKKSVGRRSWEFLHRTMGRCAIILGLVNVSLGVFLAMSNAIVWKVWFGYLGFILFVWIMAEIQKNHRDRTTSGSESLGGRRNKFVVNTKLTGYDNPAAYETQSVDGASSIGKRAVSVNGN